jgi:hypothetical protein
VLDLATNTRGLIKLPSGICTGKSFCGDVDWR